MQTGHAQDYVYGVAVGLLLLHRLDALGADVTGFPVLSVMTWAPFVAALAHHVLRAPPAAARAAGSSLARRDGLAGRVALGLLSPTTARRPASSSSEQFAAGARRSASRISSASTA